MMEKKESRTEAIVKCAIGGGALGTLGATFVISEVDTIPVAQKILFKSIAGCALVGAVVGAFWGAARPLKEEKPWTVRTEEKNSASLPVTQHTP